MAYEQQLHDFSFPSRPIFSFLFFSAVGEPFFLLFRLDLTTFVFFPLLRLSELHSVLHLLFSFRTTRRSPLRRRRFLPPPPPPLSPHHTLRPQTPALIIVKIKRGELPSFHGEGLGGETDSV